jgi:hypothetical protein
LIPRGKTGEATGIISKKRAIILLASQIMRLPGRAPSEQASL